MTEIVTTIPAQKMLNQMQPYLDKALPAFMCSDRIIMLALAELRKNPNLNKCTPKSICGTIMTCAQLGLEPGLSGMVYLIPRGEEATISLGYKGMIELAYRSERIVSVEAACVYEKDEFRMTRGTNPTIDHAPAITERGPMIGVYAIVTMKTGAKQFEFMNMADVNKIKGRSKSGAYGPWITDMEQMAQKTVIRRLLKLIPSSVSLNTAICLDEEGDRGEQRMRDIVENILSEKEKNDNVIDIQSQSDKLIDKLGG